jgi:WD40 repeat protein
MGRFLLTLVIGLAMFLGAAFYFDLFVHPPDGSVNQVSPGSGRPLAELGGLLYAGKPLPPEVPFRENPRAADAIVLRAVWMAQEKPDICAQVDGPILFIGEQVPDAVLALAGVAPFGAEPYRYAPVNQPGRDLYIVYRYLTDSQKVKKGQMVAAVDMAKALSELEIKRGKVELAISEWKASAVTHKEALLRYETALKLWNKNPPAIAEEDFREKKLAADKFGIETEGKKKAIEVARSEAKSAELLVNLHYVRNPIEGGFIKTLYKARGDSVKTQEPILQMYSTEHLQAEGPAEVQSWGRIRENMPVIIEPTVEEDPFLTFNGHKAEVTGVAVSKDARLFVSVSEDKTAYIWVKEMLAPKWGLRHADSVRSVACTPPGAKNNWCVTGCDDGSIYLWDLDNPEKEPINVIKDKHRDPVTALAFSPDGAYFASGSADNTIVVWRTAESSPLYAIDDNPPAGTVTSLAFTPQSRLVSASKDNTLRVWELHEKGAKIMGEPIGGRFGNVNHLGVSRDGRWMLFDQGKKLQLLSVADGRTTSILRDVAFGTSFDTLAQFSPDGSLLLTAGAADGKLQIWRTPTSYQRGYQVRQLASVDKSPATCAAFAPDAGLADSGPASFAISGSKDGTVYLWSVPSKQAVENHRIRNARLSLLGRAVEGGTNQVRVGVRVPNPEGRLIDGLPATIVIEP